MAEGDVRENSIEWITNSQTATICFTQGKMMNRIRKLAEQYPNEVQITAENGGDCLVAHIPYKWIKIAPPRQVSDEQREVSRQRMIALRSDPTNSLNE